tara:strand:- start:203 stop:325 length:123 start_codon:yes stop_codon:yes gene_type:complete
MTEQNNNKKHLINLYKKRIISLQNYLFRLKAKELKIKTYK